MAASIGPTGLMLESTPSRQQLAEAAVATKRLRSPSRPRCAAVIGSQAGKGRRHSDREAPARNILRGPDPVPDDLAWSRLEAATALRLPPDHHRMSHTVTW